MLSLLNSFGLVFLSEMGDKTQLLALILTTRFKKPSQIMLGILVATLLNHALASYLGSYVTQFFSPSTIKISLSIIFISFGIWILIPDKEDDFKDNKKWGAFLTTLVAFFFAEMGDKTQLATIALGAKYAAPISVTIGTTMAMLAADGLAVYFGQKFTNKIPMSLINKISSAIFILFGIAIYFGF